MEFMRSWIMNITVVIIFTMLMDILIPNNDMKKFAKVIMGLLIILVVIQPFIMAKNWGYQFQATMAQTEAFLDSSDSDKNAQSVEVFQNNTALSIYKQNLSDKIIEIVKSREELKNRKVEVGIEIENDINAKDFGSIKSIQIFVDKENGALQASSIEPVKINTKTVMNKKQGEYKWNNSKLSQDLCSDINKELGLKETAISIEIQE